MRSRARMLLAAACVVASGSIAHAETPCLAPAASTQELADASGARASAYVSVDSWVYPALDRLHALGYLDDAFVDLRPWTRLSIARMLAQSTAVMRAQEQEWLRITEVRGAEPGGATGREARGLLDALTHEFAPELNRCGLRANLDSVYTISRGITDTPLRDSYHLGQTITYDYGRPYQAGTNQYTGAGARMAYGRFALSFRGEYQHAPSALGYSPQLFDLLSTQVDLIPVASNPVQSTIPPGPVAQADQFSVLEANASVQLLGNAVSFGKSDHWMGPAAGGTFAWSNNAQNIYAFQIDRTDPLHIPLLSDLIGPVRYDFFVGSLKGHTAPNDPWVHLEKISFKPTPNVEIGFERTVIWGGRGHVPITVDSFLRSFFSVQNISVAEKFSREDPGARFGQFDFTYRLPFLRDWVTLYTDSLSHDDVSPISAPHRAGLRPGLYLSHFPGASKLDLRVEAATTDPPVSNSQVGQFLLYEAVQKQGTTNEGFLFNDAIGREDKGGNAWLTWHFDPQQQIQLSWRGVKAAKDFIPDGTTQNEFRLDDTKRLGRDRDIELHTWVQYEAWKAPVYRPGSHADVTVEGELLWYPHWSVHL